MMTLIRESKSLDNILRWPDASVSDRGNPWKSVQPAQESIRHAPFLHLCDDRHFSGSARTHQVTVITSLNAGLRDHVRTGKTSSTL